MFTARIPEWDGDYAAAALWMEIRDDALVLHVFESDNVGAAKISLDKTQVIQLMNACRKAAKALAEMGEEK